MLYVTALHWVYFSEFSAKSYIFSLKNTFEDSAYKSSPLIKSKPFDNFKARCSKIKPDYP